MSKLAHSCNRTMHQIENRALAYEGNGDIARDHFKTRLHQEGHLKGAAKT